jgi:hypothetical protein
VDAPQPPSDDDPSEAAPDPTQHDSSVVYRRFDADPKHQHLADKGDGTGFRIGSCLFRDSNGVSVDDGAKCSAEEAASREAGCGIVAVKKEVLAKENIKVASKPEADNAAHCELGTVGDKQAKRLSRNALIVKAPQGYEVDEDGKTLRRAPDDH